MLDLHATAIIMNLSPAETIAVSVLASQFNPPPSPFEEPLEPIDKPLIFPKGVYFFLNGHLVPPGVRVNDWVEQYVEANQNVEEVEEVEDAEDIQGIQHLQHVQHVDDEDDTWRLPSRPITCQGCIGGQTGKKFHMGVNGCRL